MQEKYKITGMSCSACSSAIQNALNKTDGVDFAEVNLLTESLTVSHNEKITSKDIIRIIENLGYGASKVGENREKVIVNESEAIKKRLIISVLFLIPLMYLSMGYMMGLPLPSFFVGTKNAVSFAFLQFIFCLPILYINRNFYKKGFSALFNLSPNMDSLIAIGSMASLLYGVFSIFRISYGISINDVGIINRYHSDLYFETSAMIPTIITLGKYFEALSKGKTSEAINKIMNLSPKQALVLVDGEEKLIAVEDLKVGDIVVIKPGMSIACDGEIIFGETTVDESMLTGESMPKEKFEGDRVTTATVNKSGYIRVRADKVGENTTFSEIVRLIEEASAKKAPISKLADRVSGYFVPVVIAISVLTFFVWLFVGKSFENALSFAVCVLVISCPCALGLATPVAVMVGTGRGAESGILIKSGEALENAHKIDTVVFDKTGTITKGRQAVTDVIGRETELLTIAYALEEDSEHPIAQAVCNYAKDKVKEKPIAEKFENISGNGIKAVIDNKLCYAVNNRFATEKGFSVNQFDSDYDRLSKEGKTVIYIIENAIALGIIAVADELKGDSKLAMNRLNKMGLDIVMLTGDNEFVASFISKKIGIKNTISNLLPQDKEKEIEKLIKRGKKVAMVGDGINDAPALLTADVGIAIGTGTDVAIESADIVLMGEGLIAVANAITLSKSVIKNIKENLFWAFFYNVIGIPIAAGAFYYPFGLRLNPMIAALAMSLSSLFVVTNALRLKNIKFIGEEKEKERMKKVIIDGMMCMHCVEHVKKAFENAGIIADVSLDNKCAYVPINLENEMIYSIIKEAGYAVKDIK